MKNERLRSLVGKINEVEAYKKVFAIATYYPNLTKIFIPNNPYDKLIEGYEVIKKKSSKRLKIGLQNNDDVERSVIRSKKSIKDYTLCNEFDLFVTFTFDPKKSNRYNIDECKKKMLNWIKNQRNRKGPFKYLIITELHKDGAIHFHALFKDYKGAIKKSINPKTGNHLIKKMRKVYYIPSFRLGNNEVYYIDSNPDSHSKVSSYLMKYVTKDMPLFFNKRRYLTSNNLDKPLREDNPDNWYEFKKPDRTYINEYGQFLYYEKNKSI